MVFASCLPPDYYWIYCRRLRTHTSSSEGLRLTNLNLKKIIFDIWNSTKDINELKTVFRCQARQFLDKEVVLKSEIPLVDLSCIFLIFRPAAPLLQFTRFSKWLSTNSTLFKHQVMNVLKQLGGSSHFNGWENQMFIGVRRVPPTTTTGYQLLNFTVRKRGKM